MPDRDKHYTRLEAASQKTFNDMIQDFGVVTVMNVDVYSISDIEAAANEKWDKLCVKLTPYEISKGFQPENAICHLDTLKIANITVEGPSKTISGGRYANPLIKFGKAARLEIQDALGNIKAIDALCGGIAERTVNANGDYIGLHVGEDFNKEVVIIGDTFFINKETQQQIPVKIIFYKFLPDSIFNLTQDAEGDAAVFDMNGDLLATEVLLGTSGEDNKPHALFYSIIDPNHSCEIIH